MPLPAVDATKLAELAILSAAGLVGALGTYAGSLILDMQTRRRRRRAIATALLAELSWMRHAVAVVAGSWKAVDTLQMNYARPTHDAFSTHVDLFSAVTVRAVLSFMANIVDLEQWVRHHQAIPQGAERERIHASVQRFAKATLEQADKARGELEKEGGNWTPYAFDFDGHG